mmetsp:Transcript_35563/g.65208  ORF Transcript_35563/g.65208 Transcript_35563/m.65208 type:complete len:97 (+) Transcript_35563:716-1006(+)
MQDHRLNPIPYLNEIRSIGLVCHYHVISISNFIILQVLYIQVADIFNEDTPGNEESPPLQLAASHSIHVAAYPLQAAIGDLEIKKGKKQLCHLLCS